MTCVKFSLLMLIFSRSDTRSSLLLKEKIADNKRLERQLDFFLRIAFADIKFQINPGRGYFVLKTSSHMNLPFLKVNEFYFQI